MTDAATATVRVREAQSGRVSYAEPVVLYETRSRKITLRSWFVPRTSGQELNLRLEVQVASKAVNWTWSDEQVLALDGEATAKLFDALQVGIAVSQQGAANARLMVIRLDGETALGEHDPQRVVAALTGVLAQPDVIEHLANAELSTALLGAFRNAIRYQEMSAAVNELRTHLANGDVIESIYQDWCERHPWSFGNSYVMRDTQRRITIGDNLDLMMVNVMSGFRDIIELKRPDKEILLWDADHLNFYFSSDASKAIGECHRYLDMFHEHARTGLQDHPEIVAYHPKAQIVIGRSHDWNEEKQRALHGLNCRLNSITIMSYDHLLAQGERLLELLTPAAPTDETEAQAA